MGPAYEAELRVAVAEGLLTRAQADALGEEAGALGRSPLALLGERGVLTDETLASLRADAAEVQVDRGEVATLAPGETSTLVPGEATPCEPADPDATATHAPGEPADPDATATHAPDTLAPRGRDRGEPAFPVRGWDRYEPVRFLGQGGMGMVFLARDTRLHREVALKFVRGSGEAATRRFIAEARAQARVSHERVCKVHEVGEVAGEVYIAMEHIDGEPLSAFVDRLTVEQKARLLRDAALGVHEAHRQGLVHRDLKPSNIMVERSEEGELRPYVMDFGLARTSAGGVTEPGDVLGTPHFMSPEQARGETSSLDRRADVYSLGATLYALLTGAPPFPGETALDVLGRLVAEEPRPPRALNRDIPADLEAITLRCLEKDRSLRYDSARALADDLDRFLNGDAVEARATGAWYRLRKRLAKHQRAVVAAAVAGALVLGALGFGLRARSEAAERERLARRFTEDVERIESMARYSALSPLHDIRGDQAAIRAKMEELGAEIRRAGPIATGPGEYALGRGYLALGDEERAREALEAAWQHGFHEPRAAYALALVIGHAYRAELLETASIEDKEQREAKRREIERLYRDPALAYLKQSEGADVPSTAYVAALVALYEDRLDDALTQLDAVGLGLPWFYEAPALRGDILVARATERRDQGDREGALADFAAGRKALAAAEAVGESAPEVHAAMGELEYAAMVMELYGRGDVRPRFEAGDAAAARALATLPDRYASLLLAARLARRMAEQGSNRGEKVESLLEKAVAAASRAQAVAPARPEARMELGRAYWQWGVDRKDRNEDPRPDLKRALDALEGLARGARDYDLHLQIGLVFKVWADYEDQIGEDALANRGKAIESYLSALRLDERPFDVWLDLGIAYYKRAGTPRAPDPDDDARQAIAALDKAEARNREHFLSYFYGGRARQLVAERLRARGGDARPDLRAALETYRRGLALDPTLPQLQNAMGTTLLEEAAEAWARGGDPGPDLDEARRAYELAIIAAPEQGFGYHNVGEVIVQRAAYARARGDDPGPIVREAVAAIQRAIEKLGQLALPWGNLGMAHSIEASYELDRGRDPRASVDAATAALGEALRRNPRYAQAHLYLGEARAARARWEADQGRFRAEDFEGARSEYEKAIEAAPERHAYRVAFGQFFRSWARALGAVGRDPGALLATGLDQARGVLEARPDFAEARILRANLLLAQAEAAGRTEAGLALAGRALGDFNAAFRQNPNLERAGRADAALAERLAEVPR